MRTRSPAAPDRQTRIYLKIGNFLGKGIFFSLRTLLRHSNLPFTHVCLKLALNWRNPLSGHMPTATEVPPPVLPPTQAGPPHRSVPTKVPNLPLPLHRPGNGRRYSPRFPDRQKCIHPSDYFTKKGGSLSSLRSSLLYSVHASNN